MRASVAVLAAAAAATCAGAGAAGPFKPLSSLGHLKAPPLPAHLGPELVPIPDGPLLAAAASRAKLTKEVDGIKCQPQEKVLFHIHAHLVVFVDGKARVVPYGIGIVPPLGGQNTKAG